MNKNEKFVITINREAGSGGRTVGAKLAEKLGVPFYDKALIQALMEKYHLPRGCIQLEMPETMFENFHQKTYRDHAVYTMEALHNFGYGLVLDNFGYVSSSFTLLDYLPLEAVKIHPAILAAAQTSEGMQKVLESIISLCQKLNLTAIGLGVETVEQERMLASMGCHYGQGILNARPLPKDKFLELVKDRNG
jgi:EAL domain-containing protein (putative c-di-GMP-specific phosphodiesterase class I)